MVIKQYDVYLINLDPTIGAEMRKTRPCVLISPDEMNQHLRTVQIAPMTSNTHTYPWRVAVCFQHKQGTLALDQIRTIDKQRIFKRLGRISIAEIASLKHVLHDMLVV